MSIIAGYGCFKYLIRFFVKNVFIVTPPMVYCGKLASSLMLVCDCEYKCNYLPAPLCTCCGCMKEKSNLIPFPSQSIDSSLLLIANLMSFNIMG